MPEFAEGEHSGLVVPAEVAAALPALRFAYGANHSFQRLGCAVRLGERAGDHMLQPQQLLGAHARGDVLAYAAIALEELLRVEHRLAARADIARIALRIDAPIDEIGKGLPRVERRLARLPAVAGRHGAPRPASGPVKLPRIDSGPLEALALDQREAVAFILLPVPFGGKLEVEVEALLVLARRAEIGFPRALGHDGLEPLDPGPQLDFPCPGAAVLPVCVQVVLRDFIGEEHRVLPAPA